MLRAWRDRARRRPLLTVVVPVYDVEAYLAECLDSLLAQTLRGVEVVVVDDGSTDGSPAILESYRERAGLRVVRQENQGLGAARNTGIDLARGRYLTFVDSDDTLPPDALERLVSTLERTGSDFAGGALDRFGARSPAIKGTLRQVHSVDRLATTLDETPLALYDIFCCTKVFRTDFWRTNGLRFPVGVRYEDQVPCVTAYLAARRFDVLSAVTYHWRVRDDSITRTTADVATLRDRVNVSRQVLALLEDRPRLRAVWLSRRVVGNDLGLYVRHLPGAPDEYWSLLHGWVASVMRPDDWAELDAPAAKLTVARAVASGDRAAVEALVAPSADR